MAHDLPLTDTFQNAAIAHNGGPRWTKPTLYWPTKIWNTGTSDPTGFGHVPVWAKLHDGYQADTGLVTPVQEPPDSDGNVNRATAAYVFRNDERADTEVKLAHTFHRYSGSDDFYISNLFAAVGARIQGAAGTDFQVAAGYEEALRAPSGYWFTFMMRWGITFAVLRFAILKVTGPSSPGGTSTVEQLDAANYSLTAEDLVLPDQSQNMRLTCVTNGGVVELRGYYTDPDTGLEVEVCSYDDGSGAFTGVGHQGFWLTTEIMDPTNGSDHRFIHGASSFEVGDGSGGIVYRDEFERTQTGLADTAGPDQHGVSGNVVTGYCLGDQGGKSLSGELPDWADRLTRHSSLAQIEVDNDPVGGIHLLHNPASNPYVQSTLVKLTFNTGSSGTRIAGPIVRGSAQDDGIFSFVSDTNRQGYGLLIHYALSIFVARIHRWTGSAWEVIAYRILNASGDGATVAVGTSNSFRLDVENVDGANPASGTVKLTGIIDNWTIDDWVVLGSGVTEASGEIFDNASARVLSGPAQGFFASSNASTDIFITRVEQRAVTYDLDEREQASIFVGTEKQGASGTLTVPHEFDVVEMHRDYAAQHYLDSEHMHRHAMASNQRRGWKIQSDAAKPSEALALQQFFQARDAQAQPFSWVTPDSETVTVLLAEDSLRITKTGPNSYGFSVELWESLGPEYAEASLNRFASSVVPYSAGGIEIVDYPAGDERFPVFHFVDDDGSFTFKITLASQAPLSGQYVRYALGGTAVDGTHYEVASGSESPVYFEAGETTKTLTVTLLNSAKWFTEKLLTITLDPASDGPIDETADELHAYIRPSTPPPEVGFTTSGQSKAAGTTATIVVAKTSGTSGHESPIRFYFEVDDSSTAVEGTDFNFVPAVTGAYGLYTLDNAAMSRNIFISVLPSATTGRTIIINLWHDKSDESDKNRFTHTHQLDTEPDGTSIEQFPREPSDKAHGPGGIIPPKPYNVISDSVLVNPFGDPIQVFVHRDVARGSGYHRNSFNSQVWCAGSSDGMIALQRYVRFSMFVRKPTGRDLPRFIALTIRDRGFVLAPPQSLNIGERNHTVVFDTQYAGSGGVSFDGATWGVYNTSSTFNPSGSSSDYGVEEVTIRNSDGTYSTHLRLWIIYHEKDPSALGNAMVRIFNPIYFDSPLTAGTGETHDNNIDKALGVYWPMTEVSMSLLSGPPGTFRAREGEHWEPLGGVTVTPTGNASHTITVS